MVVDGRGRSQAARATKRGSEERCDEAKRPKTLAEWIRITLDAAQMAQQLNACVGSAASRAPQIVTARTPQVQDPGRFADESNYQRVSSLSIQVLYL